MNKLKALRLSEVTSQTQANNGTVCYHDPITNCDYMSYASGYVRRKHVGKKVIYQLNKKRLVFRRLPWSHSAFYQHTERVLEMNPEKRVDIICRCVASYRKYLNIV